MFLPVNIEELTPWPQSELPTRQGDVAPLSGPSLKLSSWGPRSCDLLLQRWLMVMAIFLQRLFFVARSNKDPRQVLLITPEHRWLDVLCIYMQTAMCIYIYIFLFQLHTFIIWYCFVNIYIYFVSCLFDNKLETQKSNTLKSALILGNFCFLWVEWIWPSLRGQTVWIKGIQLLCCFFCFFLDQPCVKPTCFVLGGSGRFGDLQLAER